MGTAAGQQTKIWLRWFSLYGWINGISQVSQLSLPALHVDLLHSLHLTPDRDKVPLLVGKSQEILLQASRRLDACMMLLTWLAYAVGCHHIRGVASASKRVMTFEPNKTGSGQQIEVVFRVAGMPVQGYSLCLPTHRSFS